MKKNKKFCNLHNHTYYSALDGYGSPELMARRAAELGQPALGITDHGNMAGVIRMKDACQEHGIKAVIGSEFYTAPWGKDVSWRPDKGARSKTSFHLTAFAYNQTGFSNLLRLTELANKVGFYRYPRIDYAMLEQYNEGLVITSGCMASVVCQALNPETGVRSTDYRLVNEVFDWAMDVFGKDRYFIELQDHNIEHLRDINHELDRINNRYGFEYLATNDSHYAYADDAEGQAATLCVGTGCSIINPQEWIRNTYIDNPDYYLTSYDQMRLKSYGFDVPDSAFTNTLKVAEMVEDIKLGHEPEVKKYRFPVMPEFEHNYDDELAKLAYKGFSRIYAKQDWESWEEFGVTEERFLEAGKRLAAELVTIKKLGFSSYFLCIYDIKQYCDEHKIPMTVRGSAGGSIILYSLGITDFCPLEYGLMFERFLNPDRVSAPDADLDIAPSKRPQVIKYLIEKYGEDKTAQVSTVNHIGSKMAIRDATRILEHPYKVGDTLSKSLESKLYKVVDKNSPDYDPNFGQTPREKEVIRMAVKLEGQVRSTGLHAGAVILSDRPLVMDFPLIRPKKTSKAITKLIVGYDYETAEEVGGIKLDILGVESLGVIYRAMEMINKRHGTSYTFENLPVDDPASYELINSGDLAEVFQITGYTARESTKVIKPKNITEVMVVAAICRPGPNVYEQTFADRMHGKEKITYKHPSLEKVLKDTYGIMLFQENVMGVAIEVAGFTGGQADTLRKAISKKKGFEKVKKLFIKGAKDNGHTDEFIEEIWEDMAEFAGYGFCMAHTAAYARLAVKQSYLKAKYPIEYYAAAMTARSRKEGILTGIIKEMVTTTDIKLLPPRLGKSHPNRFIIDDEANAVRFPYTSVKHVGRAGSYLSKIDPKSVEAITEDDLKWFKKAGKRPLEILALIGAFDHLFDGDRNNAYRAVPYLSKGLLPLKQLAFLEDEVYKYSKNEFLAAEREYTGLYLTGHPLDSHPMDQPAFGDSAAYESLVGQFRLVAGVVEGIRLHRDRKGNIMAFVTIEDKNYQTMSVVVFASLYSQIDKRLCVGCVAKVLGKIELKRERDEEERQKNEKYGRVNIIAQNIIGA